MEKGINIEILRSDEITAFKLRTLYSEYGYRPYKMSKFEEYDLYVENKDFLLSDKIITFNDTDGKLMALKPDVTLSIIKNTQNDTEELHKVYYNENVYRVSSDARTFKEIMQTGLECIGEIDLYNISEVISLAAMSLDTIGKSHRLDISHMGFITLLTENLSQSTKKGILACIKNKNTHELKQICDENNVDAIIKEKLVTLASIYGKPNAVLPLLSGLCGDNPKLKTVYEELYAVCSILSNNRNTEDIFVDLSVINNINYYSGVVFQGFAEGIPCCILTGGYYGNLMRKMGRNSGGIGFAVYLDLLRELDMDETEYDTDTLLLYDKGCDIEQVFKTVNELIESGETVSAQKSIPSSTRFRRMIRLTERGIEEFE